MYSPGDGPGFRSTPRQGLSAGGQEGMTGLSLSTQTVPCFPGADVRAAEGHTATHFFARLLFRIASHSRTSWWPSSAVAKSTGVPRSLAMCS